MILGAFRVMSLVIPVDRPPRHRLLERRLVRLDVAAVYSNYVLPFMSIR